MAARRLDAYLADAVVPHQLPDPLDKLTARDLDFLREPHLRLVIQVVCHESPGHYGKRLLTILKRIAQRPSP